MLTPRFARRVVDDVMARLGHNVNLMDTSGVIVASGDPARLGTVHDAARRALRESRTVAVHADDELAGSLPGVNVPITADGETVGVVGVTGPPELVRAAAASVALTVELMLAQEAAQEEREWRRRARTQLVEDAAAGRVDAGEWRHRLDLVGCRARAPHLLLALALAAPPPVRTVHRHLDAADPGVLMALDVDDVVWVVGGHGAHDVARSRLGQLRDVLARDGVPGRMIDGGTADEVPELVRRVGRVRRAVRCGPGDDATLAELELPVLLATLDADTARAAADRVLGGLGAVHLDTLHAFLAADLVVSRAARELLVHRNTLLQRLDAIAARTGRDPRRFADAATLHAALLLRAARSP